MDRTRGNGTTEGSDMIKGNEDSLISEVTVFSNVRGTWMRYFAFFAHEVEQLTPEAKSLVIFNKGGTSND
ncbi:hypothetical protein [Paenibacillus andongensis]|uniref:hypothetical protein n=1 Tax=Paenibacillus andongensis TaxID=2975482 RepID=UPI0021BBAB86|nr:hypothetical protein [Paenibacillus andongensis]